MLVMGLTMLPMECLTYQAYNDLLNGSNTGKGDSKMFKAAPAITSPHKPQPEATAHDYEW